MLLDKICIILVHVDIETLVGYNTAFVEWVYIGMVQGDKFVILLEIGKRNAVTQRMVSSAASPAHLSLSARGASSVSTVVL